jgi:multiple antibiotic resistance protein
MFDLMLGEFGRIFFSFLIIMDPFASAVYFLNISKKFTEKEKNDAINSATFIAGAALVLFLFMGQILLSILGITIPSFQVAGGIVLLVISIKFILGTFSEKDFEVDKKTSIMIIGIPLITGPGVLTTTIIMAGTYGYTTTFLAALTALAAVWMILKFSKEIHTAIGKTGMEITSRIMWLLLTALAIEFIKQGIISTLTPL